VKNYLRIATLAVAGVFLACLSACGGGGGGAAIVPVVFNITTATLADGVVGTAYSQTITVTGGFGAKTFSISAGALPAGLVLNGTTGAITGTPTAPIGTANFTVMVVDSATPPQSDSQALTIDIVNPLLITTVSLPDATVGAAYNQAITATGGTGPYTFTISAGSLPAGLLISPAGVINGTPTATATNQTFTVRVADSSSPQLTDTQVLTIVVIGGSLGRNDSTATATALGNGTFAASISPSGNPNTIVDPDEDYYRITTTGTSTVTIDIDAHDVVPAAIGSPLDSVIEIVNAAGAQLSTCDIATSFTSPCESDDETRGIKLDSFLQIQVVGATTFYVHVVDFRGDARPDLKYEIVISGVN
jgi:hypothetical protein